MQKIYLLLILFSLFGSGAKSQSLYFPPASNALPWDTLSPTSLGWCQTKIDSLYDYLQQENSKAFIVLKDGKIVLENYFGTFTKDSIWYWASAGKTLTAFLVGKAAEENLLKLSDTSKKYLGPGWSACTPAKENKITIRNHLTMTTGLNDGVPDNHCTTDTCLQYLTDAATRWAYHNGPYSLLHNIISTATGQTVNNYMQSKLKTPTGITGIWAVSGYDHVYYSKPRSMARYGLLVQNNFIWNNDTLLHDTAYIRQMTNTSQNLNKSYGYLWWLNGKSSYMLPTTQFIFPGSIAPYAPADMVAALGKNGQIISVAKSKGITFIRMGDAPSSGGGEVSVSLCNQIWQRLNNIVCSPLPLHLLSFTAKKNKNLVTINWAIAADVAKYSFIIEQSLNGTTFFPVGKVEHNATNSYNFTDEIEKISGSKLYYRLIMKHVDGSYTYSPVVFINLAVNNSFSIFPNPTSQAITIAGVNIKQVGISDLSGRVVASYNVSNANPTIDVSTLTTGIYMVRITDKNGNSSFMPLQVTSSAK